MNHICLRAVLGLLCCLVLFTATACKSGSGGSGASVKADEAWVYFGTYTNPNNKSKGIYVSRLDLEKGTLSAPELAVESTSPAFLAIHPSHKHLYAVNEMPNFEGQRTGSVSAFAIDRATGKLTLLNQQPSNGAGPCYISLDKTGQMAMIANYGAGSVASLPIEKDGKLQRPATTIQHTGSSVNQQRQKEPHAHSINPDKANRFAFACDLGTDKIYTYRMDPAKGTLTAHDPPSVSVAPGGGPRHFAFHPGGKYAYANNEMTLTVTAFAYDADKGVLQEIQTLSTLPAGVTGGGNSTAETQVHPSGRFVYVSNRGHNTIAGFSVDQSTGKLAPIGHFPTAGRTPRNFGIDPTGEYLLAANQQSDTVVLFRIDPQTGALTQSGDPVTVPAPVCVKFLPIRR